MILRRAIVAAFTGGNYVNKDPAKEIVAQYIIPSVLLN
jgi:hypothetical protein